MKIINVRAPQVGGVPAGGFGWRKVLRFRARQGSDARGAGLEDFYLLFNFTSNTPKFPEGIHAGQIQALLVPIYPIRVGHNDLYFLIGQIPADARQLHQFVAADVINHDGDQWIVIGVRADSTAEERRVDVRLVTQPED